MVSKRVLVSSLGAVDSAANCLLELTCELNKRDGASRDERKDENYSAKKANMSYVKNLGAAWTKDGELAFEFPSSLNALLY